MSTVFPVATPISSASPLIIALDFNQEREASAFIDILNPADCVLKVGSELFTLLGPAFVKNLVARGFKVFLDLKYHDIPNTVARACCAAADLGVWMINVHALGGPAMLTAAQESLQSMGAQKPILIAVTVLTSSSAVEVAAVGITDPLVDEVLRLAQLAKSSGLDGVVCAAAEVPLIKAQCGKNFLTVTPGIRPKGIVTHDQVRVVSVERALDLGSDYLVIGRPITQAADPHAVIQEILAAF